MSAITTYEEAKENLSNKNFHFYKFKGKDICYHERIKSSHIPEQTMRKILLKSKGLEESYRPLKIKYGNFKKLMTCSWSKDKYNAVLDKYELSDSLQYKEK